MKLAKIKNYFFLILGFVCLALAFLGLFLPILPTTPFLILAAFLFSKSSQKIHNWLLKHKLFGPVINNWEKYGAISIKTKLVSSTLLVSLFSYTLFFVEVNIIIKTILAIIGICLLIFINTRPSGSV